MLTQSIAPCLGEGAVNVTLTRVKYISLHCNGGPSSQLTTRQYVLSHLKNRTPGNPTLRPSSSSYVLPHFPDPALHHLPVHNSLPYPAAFLPPHHCLLWPYDLRINGIKREDSVQRKTDGQNPPMLLRFPC